VEFDEKQPEVDRKAKAYIADPMRRRRVPIPGTQGHPGDGMNELQSNDALSPGYRSESNPFG
jgi:hypothetical protein